METSPKHHQLHNQTTTKKIPSPSSSLLPSPTGLSRSYSTSTTSSTNSNAVPHHHHHQQQHQQPPIPTPTQIPTAKPIATRSESANPYPTTFVQADTTSFKQVVQMLTGSSETAKQASSSSTAAAASTTKSGPANGSDPVSRSANHIPPVKSKSGFKLYERRNSLKNLKINPLIPVYATASGFSPRKPEILSPSILDFPALVLSPVTPLIPDPFDRSGSSHLDKAAEEKAIKEKGFYLHPSPATTPREAEPRLLPLFPTTSPRASSGSSLSS